MRQRKLRTLGKELSDRSRKSGPEMRIASEGSVG